MAERMEPLEALERTLTDRDVVDTISFALEEFCGLVVTQANTYEDAGVLTRDKGVTLTLTGGYEVQVTLVRRAWGKWSEESFGPDARDAATVE